MKILKIILILNLIFTFAACTGDGKYAERKDAFITEQVKDVFYHDPILRYRQIYIETQNKEVTLTGLVNSDSESTLARKEALAVKDVEVVHNKLKVKLPSVKKQAKESLKEIAEDAEITSRVKLALIDCPELSDYKINVSTHKGIVHLSGVVSSPTEALQAESIVLRIKGVQSVKNKLKIQQ